MARGGALERAPRAPRAPRAAPGGRSDAVADVLADDAGAQAGDLRPLRGVHLRSRHSSPSADSNRSSPSGAAPTATQTNRWSLRSAATRAQSPARCSHSVIAFQMLVQPRAAA